MKAFKLFFFGAALVVLGCAQSGHCQFQTITHSSVRGREAGMDLGHGDWIIRLAIIRKKKDNRAAFENQQCSACDSNIFHDADVAGWFRNARLGAPVSSPTDCRDLLTRLSGVAHQSKKKFGIIYNP